MKKNVKRAGAVSPAWKIVWIVLPLAAALTALCLGRIGLSPIDVLKTLTGRQTDLLTRTTVLNLRLPRILTAFLCGAGLSVAGCAFQSLFANPLAAPDTVGAASGASFGAALGLLLGFGLVGVQITSLCFGGAAVLLTWIIGAGGKKRAGMTSTVLAGIMIGSLFSALVSLIKTVADKESQLPAITYWLMGSMSGVGYRNLLFGAPPVIASVLIFFLMRWKMNLLPLPDDEIIAAGVNLRLLRGLTVGLATLITASCVSMCGQVGWIGLLVPHICRMIFGADHRALIPASVSFGGALMIIVDTAARSLSAAEIPVSILTAVLGAPFFIFLLKKKGGLEL